MYADAHVCLRLKHLHNVETCLYCPQFLSLDFQRKDNVFELK